MTGEGWRDGGAEETHEQLADVEAKEKLPASDANSALSTEARSSGNEPASVGLSFTAPARNSLTENATFPPESSALSMHRAKSDS